MKKPPKYAGTEMTATGRAEQADQGAAQNLRAFLEELPTAVLVTSPDGRILFANGRTNKQFGSDLTALGWTALDFYADSQERSYILDAIRRQGHLDDYEVQFRKCDGTLMCCLLSVRQFEFEGETALLSSIVDITAQKTVEKELKHEKGKAQSYLDIAGVMIVAVDAAQNLILANKKACEVLGYGEQEILGRNWFDLAFPEDRREEVKAIYEDLISGKRNIQEYTELPVLTCGGSKRLIAWQNVAIRDEHGKIMTVLSSGEDITEHKQATESLQSRDRYLTLINIATRDILDSQKAVDRYYYLVNYLANLFVADYAYLVRWDAFEKRTVLVSTTLPSERNARELVFETGEASITRAVLQAGSPLAIEDLPASEYAANSCFFNPPLLNAQSALGIPLITRNSWLGAVLLVYNSRHHFTAEEIHHARQAGDQFALLLWIVQQEADAQKRLLEINALVEIERTLSETERIGIETVFQLIANSARKLIPGANRVVLHTVSQNGDYLVPKAVAGYRQPEKAHLQLRISDSVAGHALTSGEAIFISDVRQDSRFSDRGMPVQFRSLMVAPVQSSEHKLGTISVQSDQPNVFSEDGARLLSAMAAQAAIAIENTRLLESIQQSLKETNALYRINQELVSSLDPDELMKDVVDLLQKNFGYYYAQIFVVDPATGDFVLRAGSGEVGRKLKEQNHRLSAGEGLVGHTAESRTAFYTNDVDGFHFFVRNSLLPDTKSELAVPVKIGEQILGLLDIQQALPASITERDVQLVSAVADQLAVALQKAELYTSLQRSLRQEQAVRSQLIHSEKLNVAGRLLASVSHELNNPLQAIQNALFLLKSEKGLSMQGRQDLEIVLSETERMATLLERLHTTYQPVRAEDFRPVQVNDMIEDVFALVATHLRHSHVSFEFHADPDLPVVPGLQGQLKQVFLNLFMNAVDAMPSGGHLTVATLLQAEREEVWISVSDTGTGVDISILPNIFDAFVSNKERGTGLGLAISSEIIHKHGGRFEAENNPDRGATFSIWLPVNRRSEA